MGKPKSNCFRQNFRLQVPIFSYNLTKARCQVEQSSRTSRPCNRSSALQPLSHHCCLKRVGMRNFESYCGPFLSCFGAAPCGSSKPTPIHTPWAMPGTWKNSWCHIRVFLIFLLHWYNPFTPFLQQKERDNLAMASMASMVLTHPKHFKTMPLEKSWLSSGPWHLSRCRQRPPPHGGRRGAPGEVFYNCFNNLEIVLQVCTFSKHFPNIFQTLSLFNDH